MIKISLSPLKLQFKGLLFSRLLQASSWLFAGGLIGGMLGYFFQIIMGRMLSVIEYGIFSAFMAIIALAGAPLLTLSMVVSRKVSSYRSEKDASNRKHLYYVTTRKALLMGLVLVALLFFFIEHLEYFLKVESNIYFFLLSFGLFIAFPQSVNNAYLQGLQYFKWLSMSGILGTLLKIIIAVWFIWLGFGVSGALGGFVFSSLIMLIITYIILRPSLKGNKECVLDNDHLSFKSIMPVLLANIAFVTMTQIDIILVKYYFTEQDAGLYAAASILGKAVMYLPGSIALALFPMVAENYAVGKDSAHLLFQAVGVTAILSSAGALIYYFFGESIITVLYGVDYKVAGEILKYFGFAILPMALIFVAEHYLIAMSRVIFAYLFMIIAPFQLLAIYYFHDTLLTIVAIISISGLILVVTGYGLLWRILKNDKKTT